MYAVVHRRYSHQRRISACLTTVLCPSSSSDRKGKTAAKTNRRVVNSSRTSAWIRTVTAAKIHTLFLRAPVGRDGRQWTEVDSRSWVLLSGAPFSIMCDTLLGRLCVRWQTTDGVVLMSDCAVAQQCAEFGGSARRIYIPGILSRYQPLAPHCKPTATRVAVQQQPSSGSL